MIKKISFAFARVLKFFLLGVLSLWLVLLLPPVQTRLAQVVTNELNKTYNVDIQVKRVNFSLFGNIILHDILIQDYKKKELISAKKIETSILDYRKLIKGDLYFGNIYGEGLFLNMVTYKGDKLSNLDIFIEHFSDKNDTISSEPFVMKAQAIFLKESKFKASDYNYSSPVLVEINQIYTHITDFFVDDSDVYLKSKSSSLVIDNYLKINELATDFAYLDSKGKIQMQKTLVKTPSSSIKGDVTFFAQNGSFANFLKKVQINADFQKSDIGTNDINLFYNGFSSNKSISFKGKMKGSLSDFFLKKAKISYQNTAFLGDVTFENLFEKEPVKISVDANYFTSIYSDLVGLMPIDLGENLPSELENFGFFTLEGSVFYTPSELVLAMQTNSQLGNFWLEGTLLHPTDIQNAQYKASIKTDNLDIGKVLKNNELAVVSSEISVAGTGLTLQNLNDFSVKAKAQNLQYKGYSFKNITLQTGVNHRILQGMAQVDDSHLKAVLESSVDFSEKEYAYEANLKIKEVDFQKIGWVKDSISQLKGNIQLYGKGNSLDDISGKIRVKELKYKNEKEVFDFQDFNVNIHFNERKERIIEINSPDIVSGKIIGKYHFKQLPELLQNSVGKIYANYRSFEIQSGQYLFFDMHLNNKVIAVFMPEISLAENTILKGKITGDEGEFKLHFKSPQIKVFNNTMKNIDLAIDTKNPLYNTFFQIEKIENNFYSVSDFNLINTKVKDTLLFRTEFKGGKENKDSFQLNFYHTIDKNRASVVGLNTSKILFKNKEWVINKQKDENQLVINRKLDSVSIKNVKIQHKNQGITFGGYWTENQHKNMHLVFDKVQLFDVIPEIEGMVLEGALNGRLSLIQQQNKYFPSSDLVVEKFSLNGYSLGDLEMGIEGNEDLTNFKVNTQFINEKQESFRTIGDISIKEKGTFVDLDVNLKKLNLLPFNPLLEGVFENLRGNITGSAHILGKINNPKVEGIFNFEKAGLLLSYLNVDVDISPEASLVLQGNSFYFTDAYLTDTAYKTKALLTGKIFHKNLTDWFLDLNLDTQNKRFLALNTKATDNELFYGTGFINGTAKVTGPVENLAISVRASTGEGTKFKIPLTETKTLGDDSFIHFVSKKKNEKKSAEPKNIEGIEMNFDLDILPSAEIEIIIDPKTGSNLIGRGVGTVLLEVNTNGKFNMWGDFITSSGEYNFKYEGIIDRKFKVLPGGSILWNGDPMSAELENLKAVYSLYANPSILLENSQFNRKIQTQVMVNLEGNLAHPQTRFDIVFPDANQSLVSELNYRLEDSDKKQLQAFALLLQGNFLSDVTAGEKVVSYNVVEAATGIFNQLLSDKEDKLNLGISYEAGGVNPNEISTTDRLGITVSTQITDRLFFNGKLGIPLGGVSQTAIAGDFEFQFLLTKDGNLSVKIFNRENEIQQYLLEKIGYTQGIGLSYKVDFQTFKELVQTLFRRQKRKK